MCKERIEAAARSVSGVKSAVWDIQSKMISVNLDDMNLPEGHIHRAIAAAGHDTEKMKADDAVYNALPECCLYRSGKEDQK
jgi:Cu(I)/Ag(I) efflux system membrane fusion protein